MLHCAKRMLLGLASNSDWGDPWVDPWGILGGSSPNSGAPAIWTRVKIGGSSETTSPLYNIKKGDQRKSASLGQDPHRVPAASRILLRPLLQTEPKAMWAN